MTHSRSGMRAAVACLALTAGCRYFRPISPYPETEAPAEQVESGRSESAGVVSAPLPDRVGDLRDANIAAMVLALNNTDISYARLVPSRSDRDDVKQFAQRMLTDHLGVNALLTETLGRLDMSPEDNLASLDLRDESADRRDAMRDLSGFAFDSVYISNEVSYHQRFLASLDRIMLPAVRNDELKTLLTTTRPAVAAHLAHAEQVWANVMARRQAR